MASQYIERNMMGMFLTTSQVGNSNFTALGTKISAKPSEDSIEFAGFIIIIILKENA